jgi:hypothetical protein
MFVHVKVLPSRSANGSSSMLVLVLSTTVLVRVSKPSSASSLLLLSGFVILIYYVTMKESFSFVILFHGSKDVEECINSNGGGFSLFLEPKFIEFAFFVTTSKKELYI